MVIHGEGVPAEGVSWWQVQHVPFGEPPFDDISQASPLRGITASRFPENELMHAATLSLFPELERLWIAAIEHSSNLPSLAPYAESCRRRLGRVLLQYLRLRRIDDGSNDYNDADEALDLTTLAFIQMVGAFDTLALFARDALELRTADQTAAWQNDKFRADIRHFSPTLASLIEPRAPGGRTFAAIRALRNTVHKAMPRPALSAVKSEDNWNEATIVLEGPLHAVTIAAFDDAGWSRFIFDEDKHPEWLRDSTNVEISGVTRLRDMLIVKPSYLLQACLNDGVPLVNQLMAAIPIVGPRVPSPRLDASASLYPQSLRAYAVDMLGLAHLAGTGVSRAEPGDSLDRGREGSQSG